MNCLSNRQIVRPSGCMWVWVFQGFWPFRWHTPIHPSRLTICFSLWMNMIIVIYWKHLPISRPRIFVGADPQPLVDQIFFNISRNRQYQDQHHTCIFEADYYLSVYNVHFTLASSTELKNLFSPIKFCHCTLKSRKSIQPSISWCDSPKKLSEMKDNCGSSRSV